MTATNVGRMPKVLDQEIGYVLRDADCRIYLLRLSSFSNAFRKFSSSRFPAYSADIWDWYPLRPILTPIGLLRRLSSQRQRMGPCSVSIVTM
jgi:hypothetical protein